MVDPHRHRTPVGSTPPPQATMGLLDYITVHSLDADYAQVAEQRSDRGESTARRPGRAAVVVFGLFGALIAVAGVQTARSAGVTASSHENLVAEVNSGAEVLDRSREALAELQVGNAAARRENSGVNSALAAEQAKERRLGTVAGSLPVSGPGVRLTVDDAEGATSDSQLVLDKDLRNIANGLWEAGAEAISINGQRLTTLSAIRQAGDFVTVNYVDVVPPYTVLAVGDPDRLPARFVESTSGTAWLNARETFGLGFDLQTDNSLTIPAADPKRLDLRAAQSQDVKGAQ